MGQFKPMVKMQTTEPTVELKLKKGGAVKKMADGGMPMGAMIGAPKGGMMPGLKPKKPSLAARRRAMMASGAAGAPAGRAESLMATAPPEMPPSLPPKPPVMKKGGKVEEMESPKAHKAEMMAISGMEKELKSHEGKSARKAHRGLKTGGVVNGNGGFKTGGVAMANAGGFAKGGAAKKFAEGGRVQHDGGPEQMKQGKKKPAGPVSINQLSGTYKKGGAVMMANGGVTKLGTSIVNKPLADNNTAARKAAEQKAAAAKMAAERAAAQKAAADKAAAERAAAQKAAADKAAAQKAAADKAAAERAAAQKAAADKAAAQKAAADKAAAERAAAQKAAAERAKPPINVSKPAISVSTPPTPQVPKREIEGLDPKTGRFAPGSMEYMAPQVTVSKSMPSPVSSAMPMPKVTPMPKSVPMVSEMPQSGYGGGGMRRGGKVQNNGKKRGGVVC
jgi:hypothetical protein